MPIDNRFRGFTLIEIALALVIITLILGSIMVPLATRVDQRKTDDTQHVLDRAMEALIGFAIVNGRLPCPASAASNGVEDPLGGGNCTIASGGYLPAVTLGLDGTDAQGYLVDGWGLPQNRIRYAVTTVSSLCSAKLFTTPGGIRSCWSKLSNQIITADLNVCPTATGITGFNCAPNTALTSIAPAVVYSLGPNAANGGTGLDEAENLDGDRAFVWHTRSPASAPNGEFDDIMVWMSPNILYARMLVAGQLP